MLHLTIKRVMSGSGTVAETRRFIEVRGKPRLPPDVEVEPVRAAAFRGEWIRTPESSNERTLLYLPGGGFMLPASQQVPLMVARINREAGMRALLVHYRLAPEHPFPAGLEDCLAAYRHLLDLGTDPKSIVIAGDSAGGGLTLSTLLALRDDGDPLPACAVVISPFTDFSFGGESRFDNARHDPMLSTDGIARMNDLYLDDALHDNPLVSPVYGDFHGLPPVLAQVGSTEVLLDDTRRVGERAISQRVDFRVEVWDEVPHVWHVWPFLPETREAIRHIGEFVTEHLARPAPKKRARARKVPSKVPAKAAAKAAGKSAGKGAGKATPKSKAGEPARRSGAPSEADTT
ncbi:MAG TPA: alpha/beta hydrolase [Rubrivivax sp.]|nr:alpha/beta hydrolase [Rubrivivax sp.]